MTTNFGMTSSRRSLLVGTGGRRWCCSPALPLGDDDQIVPIDLASRQSAKILPHGILKEIKGAPHGLTVTHADQVSTELMAFLKGWSP